MVVKVRRVYEPAEDADGLRVLVERLWPRGVGKKDPRIGMWLKEVAPSHQLRKSFHADGDWDRFVDAYTAELADRTDALDELRRLTSEHRTVTLVYASRDTEHNSAVVLRDLLRA